MKKYFYLVISLCMANTMHATDVVTFEDVVTLEGGNAVLNADNFQRNFFDEDMGVGMFSSPNGDFVFDNYCLEDWDFFCGFSISARTQTTFITTTPDQFNSCVGHGVNGSARYAVYYDAGSMMPPQKISVGTTDDLPVTGFYITNTAWVMEAILVGDGYGGAFTTGDYLKLIITGTNSNDEQKTVEVFLADFTSEDETAHTYINDWTWVDLSSLGDIKEISFAMDGSRKNDWGLTTPTYFCMDDFNGEAPAGASLEIATFEDIVVPANGHMGIDTEDDDERTEFVSGSFEFASGCMSDMGFWYWFGYANRTDTKYESLDDQWNNIVGGGYDGSANYGVAYVADFMGPCYATVLNDEPTVVPGFYITNNSWAYVAMKDGSGAKKFGLGDWFMLTITGYDADGEVTGTKEFYLADLRDAATAYIIDDWRYVDLSGLGAVKKIGFTLSSTDTGDWGMNTPAYFCFDNFGAEGEEVLPDKNVDLDDATAVVSPYQSTVTVQIYDLNGRKMDKLQKGVNIVRMSDGSVRKVMVK